MQSSNPAVWAGFEAPDGHVLGWKVVRPDGRTHGDYRWPLAPAVVEVPDPRACTRVNPCPSFPGDGLCVALTWRGARAGGIPASTGLALAYREDDVLASGQDKLRVTCVQVLGVLDLHRLICEEHAAVADLSGANLSGAHLTNADLTDANLRGADLSGAYLSGADLSGAYLSGAYLRGAYLRGADLTDANLRGAYLRGADLTDANLRGADLSGADLSGANLRYAYLRYAIGYSRESTD